MVLAAFDFNEPQIAKLPGYSRPKILPDEEGKGGALMAVGAVAVFWFSTHLRNFLNPCWNIITKWSLRQISSFVEIVVSRHQLFMICVSCMKTSMSFG